MPATRGKMSISTTELPERYIFYLSKTSFVIYNQIKTKELEWKK